LEPSAWEAIQVLKAMERTSLLILMEADLMKTLFLNPLGKLQSWLALQKDWISTLSGIAMEVI